MNRRARLSVSVDADLAQVAQEDVAAGRSESVSAWVNEAMHRQADHARRMAALGEFLAAYEAEHGEITDEEVRQARRRARARAVVVRPDSRARSSESPRGTGGP